MHLRRAIVSNTRYMEEGFTPVATCDGCERNLAEDEPAIVNITSCCGSGCYRVLCVACVKEAAELAGIILAKMSSCTSTTPSKRPQGLTAL
jgi:hypothetical protein